MIQGMKVQKIYKCVMTNLISDLRKLLIRWCDIVTISVVDLIKFVMGDNQSDQRK